MYAVLQVKMNLIVVIVILSLCQEVLTASDCSGPKMSLLSDDKRRTCTKIMASNNKIEYSCASLIKSFRKPLIKYCPVEVCLNNGTWTEPSISCAMTECYEEGFSKDYIGHRTCTISGRPCQRWEKQEPHRHVFKEPDMFPDFTISLAESYCRDPDGRKGTPWCLTLDPEKKWEYCGIQKCSELEVHDNFCGPPTTADSDGDDQEYKTAKPTMAPHVVSSEDKMTCEKDIRFKTNNGVAVKYKPHLVFPTRSALESSSMCAKEPGCRTFQYDNELKQCGFFDGPRFDTKKQKGVMVGWKLCQ